MRFFLLAMLLGPVGALRTEEPEAPPEKEPASPSSYPEADVRPEGFPEIHVQIPLSTLDSEVKADSIRFAVREGDSAQVDTPARVRSVVLPEPPAKRGGTGPLYAIVIDATKSVPMADFRRSISSAANLLEGMPTGAKTAIFRVNGKPTTVHDFDDDSDTAPRALRRVKREGKITRIYDSLFFALRETASEAKRGHRPVGGLVLFTDGRDEGSYLTEEDCLEIAAKGHDLQIPIFVVLNGAAKNERLFKRLALRSGGELFRGRVEFQQLVRSSGREDDSQPTARSPEGERERPGLKVIYSSAMPFWKAYPGRTVHTQILYDQKVIGAATYQVPGLAAFVGAHPFVFGLLFLILVSLLGLFTWLLLRSARTKSGATTNASDPQSESADQKLNIPTATSEVFFDMREEKNNPPIQPGRHIESEVTPILTAEELERLDPTKRKRYETDAITLNMKEKAYVVLQMALKEAPSYNLGVLVKKERDMNRLDQRYDLFLEETYLGNSSGATLPLKDVALAGIHAKIKRFDKKHVLFDLGGAAGTFINGKKVLRPMALRSGDEIRMGHTMFIFRGEK